MRFGSATALALVMAAGVSLASPSLAIAGDTSGGITQHPQSDYYRGEPQVRGFRQSVGGYSYSYEDGLTDAREQSVFLDPELSNDANEPGPFSGDFFSSGVGGALDTSPYP